MGDAGNSSTIDLTTLNKITGITNGVNTADKALVANNNNHIDKMYTTELHIGNSGATTKWILQLLNLTILIHHYQAL